MRILWNKKEVAILIYGYYLFEQNFRKKQEIIEEISFRLREKYPNANTDKKFRNISGISMKLGNIEYLFTDGKKGFKHYSKLEYEIYSLYLHNKEEFKLLLEEAKKEYKITWSEPL